MVLVTTYNREYLLKNLLRDIEETNYEGEVVIVDDGTKEPIQFQDYPFNICYVRFEVNHGKSKYYEVVSFAFNLLKHKPFEYCWQLPDDVSIKPDYFTKSLEKWNTIQDEKKICLSTGHTNNRHLEPCWTNYKPIQMGEIVKTQWNDLCYIAPRTFFLALNWDIEKPDANRFLNFGSGVGANISRRLNNLGFNMYHTMESLVEFKDVKTVMHV